MEDFNGRVVVITGAASGIGREMALAFARRGARIAACDIDGESLGAVRSELEAVGCEVYTEVVDVSKAWQVEEFSQNVYRDLDRVDVLCNNAGIAVGGAFEDIALEDWDRIIGVNLEGVVNGCYYFYPRMIEQGGGHIVNTSSGAGLAPLPALSPYNCTKFGVVGFSETLRSEGAIHGIGVSVLCPGIVATNITGTATLCSGTDNTEADAFMERVHRFFQRKGYPPSRIADAVIRGVEKNKGVIIYGWETHLIDILYRFSRGLYVFFLKTLTRLMEKLL